jgi:ketosteroid isomerase-like protein
MSDSANVAVVKRMALGDGAGDDDLKVGYDETIEKRIEASGEQAEIAHILETLHPDVVVHIPPSMPYGGEHIGHEGFLRMGEAMNATWDIDGDLDMKFIDIGDDQVICFVNFEASSRHTGRPVEMRMVEVYTLTEGRIIDIRLFYWDTAAVAEATGGAKTIQPSLP